MKVERWYDICCMICGKYLSTDFNYEMQPTREDALKCAKECGFGDVDCVTMCPECIAKMKSKECVNTAEAKDKMVEDHSAEEISEEKTGFWIACMNKYGDGYYECSECGYTSDKYLEKCPHCNTKMMD